MAQIEERPGLLRQRQVRELLAVSQTTLTKLRRSGDVETVRLPSGGVRISEASVQKIIRGSDLTVSFDLTITGASTDA